MIFIQYYGMIFKKSCYRNCQASFYVQEAANLQKLNFEVRKVPKRKKKEEKQIEKEKVQNENPNIDQNENQTHNTIKESMGPNTRRNP